MVASTATLNINVKTNNVDTANKKLTGLTRNGKKVEGQVIRLQDRFKSFGRNASAAVATVDGPLGGVASRISALTSVATTGGVAVTGLALAITGLAFVTQRGVRQLDEYNIELAKTEAILKATGFAAGVTAKELQDEAQAIAFATLASVQGIQQAQAVLLTFDRIQGDVRANAVGLAQDLATVFGGTAASQATQLGKALQDPIKGITALNRVGVSFNQTQKDQIKLFQDSGDIVAAQTVIIEALKNQVGGAGESVAKDSLAGKLDTAGQLFANFTANLAKSTGAYDATLNFFDGLNEKLSSLGDSLADPSLEEITKTIEDQYKKIDNLEAARDATSNKRLQNRKQRQIDAANDALDVLLNQQAAIAREVVIEDEKKIEAKEGQIKKQKEIQAEADQAELERLGKARVERLKAEYLLSEELQLIREERSADAQQLIREETQAIADAYDQLRSSIGSSLEDGADAIKVFSGESSAAYRAAFALSKAFAVGQATMNFGLALSQAMAAPDALTLSAKLANYGAVAATVGPLLSSIAGVKMGGGRLQGGAVDSGTARMVGERGPELFIPSTNGSIVNNNKLRNGGSAGSEMNVTIVNQTTGRIDQIEKQQITETDIVMIIKETVPSEISNPNSKTSKAINQSTSASRRLR
jgi:hypothetical protein